MGELPPDVPALAATLIKHSLRLLQDNPQNRIVAAVVAERAHTDLLSRGAPAEDVEPLAAFARSLRAPGGGEQD